MKDSFVFYRSFIEAGEDLDGDTFKRLIMAIGKYAMDGTEPELQGVDNALFKSWRPLVDKANERYEKQRENGKKGGRPKKTPKNPKKPNETQNNPTEPNPNLNDNVNVNVNDNVNDNVNAREKENDKKKKPARHRYGEYKHVLLSDDQHRKLVEKHGEQKAVELIKILDEGIESKGYNYKNHLIVLNGWVLRKWEEERNRGAPSPRKTRDEQVEEDFKRRFAFVNQ